MTDPSVEPSVDGRTFRPVRSDDERGDETEHGNGNEGGGDVGTETTFHFDQTADLVHARYEGGDVRLGHLVGLHLGDELRFRYAHVTTDGETATGQSTDRIERLNDGRLRLHEEWSWDSKSGTGTSVLVECVSDRDEH